MTFESDFKLHRVLLGGLTPGPKLIIDGPGGIWGVLYKLLVGCGSSTTSIFYFMSKWVVQCKLKSV